MNKKQESFMMLKGYCYKPQKYWISYMKACEYLVEKHNIDLTHIYKQNVNNWIINFIIEDRKNLILLLTEWIKNKDIKKEILEDLKISINILTENYNFFEINFTKDDEGLINLLSYFGLEIESIFVKSSNLSIKIEVLNEYAYINYV